MSTFYRSFYRIQTPCDVSEVSIRPAPQSFVGLVPSAQLLSTRSPGLLLADVSTGSAPLAADELGFFRWMASSDVRCSSGLHLSVVHLTVAQHCAHRLPVHVMSNYAQMFCGPGMRSRSRVPAYFERSRSRTRPGIFSSESESESES